MRIYKVEESNRQDSGLSEFNKTGLVVVTFEFDTVEQSHKYYELINKELRKQDNNDEKNRIKTQIKRLKQDLKEIK